MIALIGSSGVIGSEILKNLADNVVCTFGRDNIEDLPLIDYDVVICTAPTSQKFKINHHLSDEDQDIFKLCQAIEQVKTSHFILVSSQAAIDEVGTPYGSMQAQVLKSVLQSQSPYTIYMMDTLYGKSLTKGFISDLLTRQWQFLSNSVMLEKPELQVYYQKISHDFWERTDQVPNALLSELPDIANVWSDQKVYQLTSINSLVSAIITNLHTPLGKLHRLNDSQLLTGEQVKEICRGEKEVEESALSHYVRKYHENLLQR